MVARKIETVLERFGKRVVGVRGKRGKALAHIARRRDMRLFAQDPRRAAIIGHGNDSRGADAHRKQRSDGHGRARAPADYHCAQLRRIDGALQRVGKMKRPDCLKGLGGRGVEPEAMPRAARFALAHFATSLFVSAKAMSRW